MRAVVQRVKDASVSVDDEVVARIDHGLLVLAGFTDTDTEEIVQWMARKLPGLRVFEDADGRMNLDVEAVGGQLLVVSQFTLYGDCTKGKRPSFGKSAPADAAERLFNRFVELLREETPVSVETGVFQAHMAVGFTNDGPVTLVLDKETA